MSTPPEANTEYSRGSGASGPAFWRASRRASGSPPPPPSARGSLAGERRGPLLAIVVLGALLGALLVFVSQFTSLYQLHSAASSAPIKTVGTGANHAWAPIPLALLAVAFAYVVHRSESRPALMALALLGIVTLLIALLGDLPDAHSSGVVGSSVSNYVQATSTPSAGLYMETLGAVVLLISGGIGLVGLAERPRRRERLPTEP